MAASKFSSSGSLFSGEPLSLICFNLDGSPAFIISFCFDVVVFHFCLVKQQVVLATVGCRGSWVPVCMGPVGKAEPILARTRCCLMRSPCQSLPGGQPACGQALQEGTVLVCVEVGGRDKPTKLIFPFSGRAFTSQNMHMIHYSINFSCAFCLQRVICSATLSLEQ